MNKDIKFLICILVWFVPSLVLSYVLEWVGFTTNDPMGLVYLMLCFGLSTVVSGLLMNRWGVNDA